MTTRQPTNPNFLPQNKFKFTLQRAPNVEFFTYRVELPGLQLMSATQATPFIMIPRPGNKMTFDDFDLEFMVDEDMKNYLEIFNWMTDLGFPDDFTGYPRLEKGDGIVSDASLHIQTSAKNPNILVRYRDIFPVGLSSLDFNAQDDETEHLIARVTFKYQRFYISTEPK